MALISIDAPSAFAISPMIRRAALLSPEGRAIATRAPLGAGRGALLFAEAFYWLRACTLATASAARALPAFGGDFSGSTMKVEVGAELVPGLTG
jgi:hypothetical protein